MKYTIGMALVLLTASASAQANEYSRDLGKCAGFLGTASALAEDDSTKKSTEELIDVFSMMAAKNNARIDQVVMDRAGSEYAERVVSIMQGDHTPEERDAQLEAHLQQGIDACGEVQLREEVQQTLGSGVPH